MTMVSTNLPVAFSGAPGAYSEEAALRFFGTKTLTLTCESSRDALAAVSEGRARHAVIPVENTVTGFFDGLVEALSERSELAGDSSDGHFRKFGSCRSWSRRP